MEIIIEENSESDKAQWAAANSSVSTVSGLTGRFLAQSTRSARNFTQVATSKVMKKVMLKKRANLAKFLTL